MGLKSFIIKPFCILRFVLLTKTSFSNANQMAKTNGQHLSDADIEKMKLIIEDVAKESKKDKNLNPLHMFRGKFLTKTLILAFCWITVCFGFYALTLNATEVILPVHGMWW